MFAAVPRRSAGGLTRNPSELANLIHGNAASGVKMGQAFARPNSQTFTIPPILEFIHRHIDTETMAIVDPYARNSGLSGTALTNDLDPSTSARWHLRSDKFLEMVAGSNILVDAVVYDPPYSPRQISECYKRSNIKCTQSDTQNSSLHARCRRHIHRILKPGGVVLSFGWNSTGMGRQYTTKEILMVAHGGSHNDTICVAQTRNPSDEKVVTA